MFFANRGRYDINNTDFNRNQTGLLKSHEGCSYGLNFNRCSFGSLREADTPSRSCESSLFRDDKIVFDMLQRRRPLPVAPPNISIYLAGSAIEPTKLYLILSRLY
ncbi:hypothetical protein NPIL_702301 [Nephila pilipes]|uniref:Uncharacterized protein n=1 Tax=Nephila pilipes TaxID=299642 RepID=A0A8X6N4H4_NEPPI|nr:hypothetical protein NPIL_702301 [Nephila pilipes]